MTTNSGTPSPNKQLQENPFLLLLVLIMEEDRRAERNFRDWLGLKKSELDDDNEEERDVLGVEVSRVDEIEMETAIFAASRYICSGRECQNFIDKSFKIEKHSNNNMI